MNSIKPFLSCIVCKKFLTRHGLHNHYLSMHTSLEDKIKITGFGLKKPKSYEELELYKQKSISFRLEKERLNLLNPRYCKNCSEFLQYNKNLYCSSSCSAKKTNLGKRHSDEIKRKISTAIRNKDNRIYIGPYTKIYLCRCRYSGKIWYDIKPKKIFPEYSGLYKEYQFRCKFLFSLKEYSLWFYDAGILIEKHGWYSTPGSNKHGIKNINGISRDHMISVSHGFINKIDSWYISHPANCMLMPHSKNQNKRTKCSISLEELKLRIKQFDILYPNNSYMAGPLRDDRSSLVLETRILPT